MAKPILPTGKKPVTKPYVKALVKKVRDTTENTELSLPDGPSEPDTNLNHYTFLLYGREKIAKSTILASWPDALFFMTEPGAKGMRIAKFNDENGGVDSWETFLRGVELLEKSKRFESIIIDTVDLLYQMCFDYVCKSRNVEHPSEINGGKGDYGGTWAKITKEFLTAIHRISRTNRGLVFVSHMKTEKLTTRAGTEYSQIHPTVSGKAGEAVMALVDYIFYADHCQNIPGVWDKSQGETPRCLICRGDDTLIAGARCPPGAPVFPAYIPCNREGTYDLIKKAFDGEYDGLDEEKVLPTRTSPTTVADFMVKQGKKKA